MELNKRSGTTTHGEKRHIVDESTVLYGFALSHCQQSLQRESFREAIEGETLCQNCLARVRKLRSLTVLEEVKIEKKKEIPVGIEVERTARVTLYLDEENEGSAVFQLIRELRDYADWLDSCEDEIESVIIEVN